MKPVILNNYEQLLKSQLTTTSDGTEQNLLVVLSYLC